MGKESFDRGRWRRALQLSKLGAKLALKQGRGLIASDEARVHREIAAILVRELGKLKGLPMKIGQILSYMDGAVPDEYREIYQDALATLRTRASPIEPGACLEVIEQELGLPPEQAFESFDPEPIAIASIGQVYRARFDGQDVCVKVQYPGIAEATSSDLRNAQSIITLMRTLMPKIDTRQMIEDFSDRLREECDYHQEATYQRKFAAIYANDPDLIIPEVIDARSTGLVLTTVYLPGTPLDEILKDASQEERDRAGQALFRMAFGTLLEHGLFHADPHPGNLLLRTGTDQRLGVLDFGCVQPIDDDARRDLGALIRAAMQGEDLAGPAKRALGIEDIDDETNAVTITIVRAILAPVLERQPYRFTRAFATNIARAVIEAKMSLAPRFLTQRGRFKVNRQGVMFVVRNLFGLASVWGALEASGEYRALTESMLERAKL